MKKNAKVPTSSASGARNVVTRTSGCRRWVTTGAGRVSSGQRPSVPRRHGSARMRGPVERKRPPLEDPPATGDGRPGDAGPAHDDRAADRLREPSQDL